MELKDLAVFVAAIMIPGGAIAFYCHEILEALQNLRGGGPRPPSHPLPANDGAFLRRARRRAAKLNTREVGDVTVVDVSGWIALGEGSSAMRDTLRELVNSGKKKVLLNVSDVTYIDSSGIGELVSGFTTVANAGGTLKLLGLTKRAKVAVLERLG